jgi:membrane associated rhomboid family serine protease
VIFAIMAIDAILLIPVKNGGGSQFLDLYGFTGAHPTLLTFFSALFLHVGYLHYIGNMWFLWIFGRKIEATLGHAVFGAFYLVCGIGGQLVYWLTALHSAIPCVGASGAISGIAGLYLILYPKDRFDLYLYFGWWRIKKFESNTRVAVGVWIGEQTLLALLTMFLPFSGVAFWAHVGGFAAGMGLASLYCARVPEAARPTFATIEVPLDDEIAQPNPVIGLNLQTPSARLVSSENHRESQQT